MMVYGMVSMVRYGKGDIMYVSWYNMLGTNERTKLDKSAIRPDVSRNLGVSDRRFTEFRGFRTAIYENSCRTAGHLHVGRGPKDVGR